MRWNDLHDNNYCLDTAFEKYPFLADVSEASLIICMGAYMLDDVCHSIVQLVRELERATGDSGICEVTKTKFKNIAAKVSKQASLEASSSSRLRNVMKDLEACTWYFIEFLFTGDDVVVALMLMVYMFPEVRSKPDSNRVIYFTKVYIILLCVPIMKCQVV